MVREKLTEKQKEKAKKEQNPLQKQKNLDRQRKLQLLRRELEANYVLFLSMISNDIDNESC